MASSLDNDARRRGMLYAFLLSREGWTSMADVAYRLREHYPDYGWVSSFHNSAVRRRITADIEAINESEDYPMIIISGRRGIKLADRDEFERFVQAESGELYRKFKRLRRMIRKAGRDRQIDLEGAVVGAFMEDK